MTKKFGNSYWLYLLVLLLAAQAILFAAVFSVGDAQARFPQTTRINTIVQGPGVIKSDCLISGGTQIVLLGNAKKAEFSLVAEKETAVRINWVVQSGEATVKFSTPERELVNGSELQLEPNAVMTVTVEIAGNTEETVNVSVTCGELSCVFRTEIVAEEESPEQNPTEGAEPGGEGTENGETGEGTGNTQPENDSPENETPDNGTTGNESIENGSAGENGESENGETGEGAGNTQPEDNSPENETPDNETTDNGTTGNDPIENESTGETDSEKEPSEPAEGEGEAGQGGNAADSGTGEAPTSPDSTGDTTGNTTGTEGDNETTEDPPVTQPEIPDDGTETPENPTDGEEDLPQEPTVHIATISEVDKNGYIPVMLTSGDGGDITVNMNGDPFPAFTRYSADAGETWYLLYAGGDVSINAAEKIIVVLLDLPMEAVSELDEITVTALQNDVGSSVNTKLINISLPENVLILSKEYTHLEDDETERTDVSEIMVEVPLSWEDPECIVEMLIEEEGKVTYSPIIVDEETPIQIKIENIELEDETANQTITLLMGEEYPPAGTYRIKCSWEYEDVCYMQAEIPFFINYSTCSDTKA